MPDHKLIDRVAVIVARRRAKPGHPAAAPTERDRAAARDVVEHLGEIGRLLPEDSCKVGFNTSGEARVVWARDADRTMVSRQFLDAVIDAANTRLKHAETIRRQRTEARELLGALRDLAGAADRMRDRFADATPDVFRQDLWAPLCDAADRARTTLDLLEPPATTSAQTGDPR